MIVSKQLLNPHGRIIGVFGAENNQTIVNVKRLDGLEYEKYEKNSVLLSAFIGYGCMQ